MKKTLLSLCALVAIGSATCSFGQIQVAGNLQVNVDATGAPVGPLAYLTNSGAMGGVFIAKSNNVITVTPEIIALGGNGTRGVLLDGNCVSLQHYTDVSGATVMLPPVGLTGANPIFSVEVWMYKSTVTEATGPVAWGNRANGQNVSCNWGRRLEWGGFSWQGGGWDHGWNSVPTAGEWHHLVWTYDGAGNLKLYRDNVLDKAVVQVAAVNVNPNYNILLGVQHDTANWNGFVNGVLAKVRIHDGVLTPAQIANNYGLEVGGFVNGTAVQDLVSGPIHRYSFNQSATNNAVGLTVPDTGTAPGAAAIIRGTSGNANFDGNQLNLNGGGSGTSSYVDLPNGLISSQSSSNGGSGQITCEMWVTPTAQNWTRLFDFGTNAGTGEITAPGGASSGRSYFMLTAQIGGDLEHSRVEVYGPTDNSGSSVTVGSRMVPDVFRGSYGQTHYVVTWDEASNVIKAYINGVLAGSYRVAYKINGVVDVNNFLGRSNWSGDNNMGGGYREFRIYNRLLSEAEVRRNFQIGPADTLDPNTLVWNGNVDGIWNTSTANWLANAASVNYTDGSNVRLDDSATGTSTLSLAGTLSPASVIAANETKSYSIGGSGKISGTGGLIKEGANTVTFTGSQLNDYTGPTLLLSGKTVVSSLANAGAPSALGLGSADPSSLVVKGTLSYQGSPVTIDRGITWGSPLSTIEVLNSLTLSGSIRPGGSSGFAKTGPGTLVFANSVSNILTGGAGPGFNVAQGTVVFDGNPSGGTQTNRITGELWVGGTRAYGGNMVISNSTLLADTWVGIGRGNGSIGNVSTMRLENGRLIIAANGLAIGYQPGYNTNFASQVLTLNGNSGIYMPGNTQIGESSGSSATVNLNGSSWIRNTRLLLGMGAGTTGAVYIANSAAITNASGGYASVGVAAATAALPGGAGTMVIRDNGAYYSTGDFNVSDLGGTSGGSVGQVDVMNNATLTMGNLYVGKGAWTTAVLNQSGGNIAVGGTIYAGNVAGSQGTLDVSGGLLWITNPANNFILGPAGTGILTVRDSGTVIATNNLILGNASGATATVNLNGGTLATRRIYMGNAGATSYLNLNGGILRAADGANPDFLAGLSVAYVMAGGARIDSGANNITIAQDLYDGGGGGVTKLGAGSLKLAGNLYYSGPNVVSAGKLELPTSAFGNGSCTVADGATLGVRIASPGTSLNTVSLAVGSASGASLDFDLGNFGNPLIAPLTVLGPMTASAGSLINIGIENTLSVGTVPLISYLSFAGTFTLGTLPPGVEAHLVDTGVSINLVVTRVSLPRWEGLAGGIWDIGGTTNWLDRVTGLPMFFQQGYSVVFDDLAAGPTTVALNTTVNPGGVLVSNTTLAYTISGTGRIGGGSGLAKKGTGTLTLSTTNNNYTGGTLIDEGGTLVTTVANNLGTNGPLTMGTGTLGLGANNQRFSTVTVTNGTVTGAATLTSPAFNLDSGSISPVLAGGTLSTFGPNTNAVTVGGANTYTGRTILGGSTLVVPTLANGGAASGVGASSANLTNLVFAGGGLSYMGPATTIDRGYLVAGGGTFSVSGNLALAGEVAASSGNFVKAGPATLAYVRPGTNVLSVGGYNVAAGTLLFNGGASTPPNYLQTNRVVGEMWIGYDQVNAGNLVLTNTSLGITSWLTTDRGNGTSGLSSKITLYDSVVTSGNFSMGYDNGITGNSSFSMLTLLGNSSLTINARTFVGESAGSDANIVVAGTSRLTLNSEWFALGNSGKGTMTLSNSARVSLPGDCNLGDLTGGNGTLNVYDTATNLAATLYVGKRATSVGVVNQYGGYVGRSSGGGDWRIAGTADADNSAVGTYNLYGGLFEPVGNFQIGAYGNGTWNQTGGIANCANYPVVGRFTNSVGTMTVSGGTFNQTGGGQLLIIGEEGIGTLTITNTGRVTSANGVSIGHTPNGVGVINLDGGRLVTTRLFQNGAGASSTVNLNGGVLTANANNANFMSGLGAVNVLAGGAAIDTTNYSITIAQPLLTTGTGGGLTKLGAGALTLSGASTYTGLTTVNDGVLAVNGSIPGAALVRAGAGIGGNGSIGGVVTVEAGGAISAGVGLGALSLGASPVLHGFVVAEVNRNGGSPLADRINVTGPIAYGGTLVITNAGAPLQVGDTFTLFSASGYSGVFTLLSQTPGQTVTWNTAGLTGNGTISVATVSNMPTTPTNITVKLVGSNIEVSWPTNYTGWRLEAQTNSLAVGLSTNWATWPGSTLVNSVTMPITTNNPTVFFRLVYP